MQVFGQGKIGEHGNTLGRMIIDLLTCFFFVAQMKPQSYSSCRVVLINYVTTSFQDPCGR
jgi:hypothetical protein